MTHLLCLLAGAVVGALAVTAVRWRRTVHRRWSGFWNQARHGAGYRSNDHFWDTASTGPRSLP